MRRVLLACVAVAVLTIALAVLMLGEEPHPSTSPHALAPSAQLEPAALRAPPRTAVALVDTDPPGAPQEHPASQVPDTPVAFVYGAVMGPEGRPVHDVHVRFSALDPRGRWTGPHEFDCDELGSYAGQLPPGMWMASVVLGVSNSAPHRDDALSAANHPLRELVQPLPIINSLRSGSATEFSFQFGGGAGRVEGRIVDERGGPFAGLEVYLAIQEIENVATGERVAMGLSSFVAKQLTDEQGRFRFEGLQPATYTVSVEPEGFNPTAAPGGSKVGQRVPLQEVLVGSGRASLELTARRPHPVRVDGRVVPYAAWARLTLILPANDQGRDRDRRTSVPIAQGGAFSFYVEGHELSALLELADRETTTVSLTFSPADESFFITIPLP